MAPGETTFEAEASKRHPVLRAICCSAALAMLGTLTLRLDIDVARFFHAARLPQALQQILQRAEGFGHFLVVTSILIAVVLLDPRRYALIPRLLCCTWGAGLAANLLKFVVPRARPYSLSLENLHALDTFRAVSPGIRQSGWQSFPSAHTSTAVGLAVILSTLYPRGRHYFVALAVLCGLQRAQGLSHFASDVLFGAALGVLVSGLCAEARFLDSWPSFVRRRYIQWKNRSSRAESPAEPESFDIPRAA